MVKHCPITNCSCGLENRGCCTYDSGKFILNVENQQKFLPKPFFGRVTVTLKPKNIKRQKLQTGLVRKYQCSKFFYCLEFLGVQNFNMILKSVFSKNSEILKVFSNKKSEALTRQNKK